MADTVLTTTDLAVIIGYVTGYEPKRPNSKETAIKRLGTALEAKLGPNSGTLEAILGAKGQAEAVGIVLDAVEAADRPAPEAPEAAPAGAGSARDLRDEMAAGRVRQTAQRLAAVAEAGIMPPPPDFSAETHARFRGKLAKLVEMAEAGDIEGLRAEKINPISSSPKAMDRYRNAAVRALEVQAAKG